MAPSIQARGRDKKAKRLPPITPKTSVRPWILPCSLTVAKREGRAERGGWDFSEMKVSPCAETEDLAEKDLTENKEGARSKQFDLNMRLGLFGEIPRAKCGWMETSRKRMVKVMPL